MNSHEIVLNVSLYIQDRVKALREMDPGAEVLIRADELGKIAARLQVAVQQAQQMPNIDNTVRH